MPQYNRIAIFISLFFLSSILQAQTEWIDYVDPLIGTGRSTVPSASKHGSGTEGLAQTYPAVGEPFAMTFWTPQTKASVQKCISPYYYEDSLINGFRASHWMSGSCTQDYGSMSIMPITGSLKTSPEVFGSTFQHSQESASPDLYTVTLDKYDIDVKMTAANHAGIFQFDFARQDTHYVLVYPNLREEEGQGWVKVIPEHNEIIGYSPVHRIYQGWGLPGGFKGYFVVQFDQSFDLVGTWKEQKIRDSLTATHNKPLGGYVGFLPSNDPSIKVKVGMSFSNIQQAYNNLETEIPGWDIEQVQSATRAKWNEHLGRIAVSGTNEQDKTSFYTALYHTMLLPRQFSDVDGTYRGFGEDTSLYHAEDFIYYADFSMWDTYRAVHPLYNIIFPERSKDMMQSLVLKAEQGDWLPIFPCWNNYTAAMIGDHVMATLADAYVKGIRGFDIEKGYQYMWKNATQTPEQYEDYVNGKGRRALEAYLKHGYVPLEEGVKEAFHKNEQVSRTLEYAYDDFCLSQIALALGKTEDYEQLTQRAKNYQHLFDPQMGFMRGKYSDGRWYESFVADEKQYMYTEGTAWQYSWYVPHDVEGLIALHGGKEAFTTKLDSVFSEGHYWHGNEPSHHISFLFNYAGQPWKTQQHVRHILYQEYGTGPGGLSGNDDAGQMSAWYVFGAIGMYPVCPGKPEYALCSPIFEEINIQVPDSSPFTIQTKTNSNQAIFISKTSYNGQPVETPFITHDMIQKGGVLSLELSEKHP